MSDLRISASVGKFDLNLQPLNVVDAPKQFAQSIGSDAIVLPAKLRKFFNDAGFRCDNETYLQIDVQGQIHHIYVEDYEQDVCLSLKKRRPIQLVYGIYINPSSNWRSIVSGQLFDLKSYGLLEEAQLHVVVTDAYHTPGVESLVRDICGSMASFTIHRINRYEYWALDKVWQLAQDNQDSIVAYLHTKGMSHNTINRIKSERILTERTFRRWRWVMQLLSNQHIDKVGMFPAPPGWIWYNFWYARGVYLARCEKPGVPDQGRNRYYYESWLYTGAKGLRGADCYSQWAGVTGKTFTSKEAGLAMHSLHPTI